MRYFTCDIRNVKIDGVEIKNALIVNGIQDGPEQPDLTYLIPEAYRGADIVGKRYVPETQTFELVDPVPEVHEPTQLDILEAEVAYHTLLLEGLANV